MAVELSCKQIAKSEEDLLDLYFLVTYFETVISGMNEVMIFSRPLLYCDDMFHRHLLCVGQ